MTSITSNEKLKFKSANKHKQTPYARSLSLKKAQTKYYNKNKCKLVKEQIIYNKEYVKRDFICDCGESLHIAGKYAHIRSKKHYTRLDNLKNGRPADYKNGNLKYSCDCGSICLIKNISIHNKSKKHQKHLAQMREDTSETATSETATSEAIIENIKMLIIS